MGIKNLNKYLLKRCSKNAIRRVPISDLANSTFVIDTSIYMYKYLGENALIENMYLLMSIMQINNIKPVFIFDGKPPPEKKELLQMRSDLKKEAKEKYENIEKQILDASFQNILLPNRKKMLEEMEQLKVQFLRVRENHVVKVKELMDAFGVHYVPSPCEADNLCAHLSIIGNNSYCVSDDMDMFIYGPKYIIRNINLINKTVWLYDTTLILEELGLTKEEFQKILVLSGTDYNIDTLTSLKETLKWYYQYKKNTTNTDIEFYNWLLLNTRYIKDHTKLINVHNYFTKEYNKIFLEYDFELDKKKEKNTEKIQEIMKNEGFVYLN